MTKCPIGLICEFFDCDNRQCFQLVKPWPLPYCDRSFDIEWRTKWGFLVEIPQYNDSYTGDPDKDESIHRYNEWVGHIRQELWYSGWWEAIKIPLQPHPSGGLLVTDRLRMEQSVTLACSLDYYQELDSGFEPPVPIHAYQRLYGKQYLVEEEEDHIKDPPTLKDYHLLYASNFLAGFDDLYPLKIGISYF